jgi:hypothetical protein
VLNTLPQRALQVTSHFVEQPDADTYHEDHMAAAASSTAGGNFNDSSRQFFTSGAGALLTDEPGAPHTSVTFSSIAPECQQQSQQPHRQQEPSETVGAG